MVGFISGNEEWSPVVTVPPGKPIEIFLFRFGSSSEDLCSCFITRFADTFSLWGGNSVGSVKSQQ